MTSSVVFERWRPLAPGVPLVKVCGLRREGDVSAAVAAGASAIGVVLWPQSPRAVTIETAAALRRLVPASVAFVGVFVDASSDAVVRGVRDAQFDVVQLHGDEAFPFDVAVPVLKVVSGASPTSAWVTHERPDVALLVDTRDDRLRGGTGRVGDWGAAAELAGRRPLVLAGGLNAGNVVDAIRRVRPAAVDVSSGVESAPGVKDVRRLEAFLDAVRHVEAVR